MSDKITDFKAVTRTDYTIENPEKYQRMWCKKAKKTHRRKHVTETNWWADPSVNGLGVGIWEGHEADQPVFSSLFCSFSHFSSGSK